MRRTGILLMLCLSFFILSYLSCDEVIDKTKISPEYPYLPSDVKSLVDRTFSINATERGEAAYKLGLLGEKAEKASPFLIRILDDNNPIFCRYDGYGVWTTPGKESAKALTKIGKSTFKYILPVLENKHPYISLKPDMERNMILFLTEISGQNFGDDFFRWVSWIKSQEM
ncbi:MAG TPA: hypothetical protein PLQ41_04740 [bacterium]|nr:hypothetical protein [bacterium]HPP30007.1 hypothetical protein [bacterium]